MCPALPRSLVELDFAEASESRPHIDLMTGPYRDWRHYQEETALFFRNLGCSAEVEALVQGPHAQHEIDVWVRFLRYGIECKWIIECKLWNKRVSKEKVMALKGVVDDVGADRGIIVTCPFGKDV